MTNYELIDSEDALEAACKHFAQQAVICVDTEFFREVTYYPQLALVQIACGERTVCIDPLVIDNIQPLLDLLLNPDVLKVLHSSGQDMEVFHCSYNILPTPVFDTQIAANKLGYGDQLSYAALIKQCLDIDVDKSQTRTNWLQRPLSQRQLEYAANDVIYLAQCFPIIHQQLKEQNLLKELNGAFSDISHPQRFEVPYEKMWRKVKGHRHLPREEQVLLKSLAAWREKEAQKIDRPRRHTLSDEGLIEIVKQRPQDREQLLGLPALKRYGILDESVNELLECLQSN
ncbi:MAG: ribonuclease D [Gammaproteobacteria bacterium]|nr:ribonuclease D [Gammaproteobacteria bacterium]